jgi:hypothetical protein
VRDQGTCCAREAGRAQSVICPSPRKRAGTPIGCHFGHGSRWGSAGRGRLCSPELQFGRPSKDVLPPRYPMPASCGPGQEFVFGVMRGGNALSQRLIKSYAGRSRPGIRCRGCGGGGNATNFGAEYNRVLPSFAADLSVRRPEPGRTGRAAPKHRYPSGLYCEPGPNLTLFLDGIYSVVCCYVKKRGASPLKRRKPGTGFGGIQLPASGWRRAAPGETPPSRDLRPHRIGTRCGRLGVT